jgi:transposase
MTRYGNPELTPTKQAFIIAYRDAGLSYRQIAQRVGGVGASTCLRTVQREQKHHTLLDLPCLV